jgi:dinuclear metal center YbgI/SA1388 family protein
MVERNKIVKFCEDFLKVNEFEDYCHNGLQVEGAKEVDKIITGVSLSQKLIGAAIEKKAQMIIVHHGLFRLIFESKQISGIFKNRLKLLLSNELNLMGFHLPLDAHPEIGNNISLCKLFGVLKNTEPFDVGFIGELSKEIKFSDLVALVNEKLDTNSYSLAAGPVNSKKIAIISGGASPDFKEAAEKSADTYICGDVREEIVRGVEEVGINFINAGHYNTEKLGIQNLGEVIAKEFNIEVEFIDVPCEI